MSTRSDIIVHGADGRWRRIYCHFDGYPSHVGQVLHDHYTDPVKLDQLMELGSLSSLGEEIGEKHPFDAPYMDEAAYRAYENRYSKMCKAYGRDRGESDVDAVVGNTLAEVWPSKDTWTDYTYVWKDKKWWFCKQTSGPSKLKDLETELNKLKKNGQE